MVNIFELTNGRYEVVLKLQFSIELIIRDYVVYYLLNSQTLKMPLPIMPMYMITFERFLDNTSMNVCIRVVTKYGLKFIWFG